MSNADLITRFFELFDEEDVDALLELFTEDCSFSMILYERDLQGKADLRTFFSEHIANWSSIANGPPRSWSRATQAPRSSTSRAS